MIKKHIEYVRTRPHAEKSSRAFFVALALTGIIVVAWFTTVFSNPQAYFTPKNQDKAQNLANSGSLFDVVKEGFK